MDSGKTAGETREEAAVAAQVRERGVGPGHGMGMERSEGIITAQLLLIGCGEEEESKTAPSPTAQAAEDMGSGVISWC